MLSNSKTSTFSSEVQLHFPVSHCAHQCDCVKTVPFCRYSKRGFSHSSKAKRHHSWTPSLE